jgi:uncharacterized protein (DUF1778 family)
MKASLSDFGRAAQTRAQEVLADQRTIALNEVEAARFLVALEQPDKGTVARLEDLRGWKTCVGRDEKNHQENIRW